MLSVFKKEMWAYIISPIPYVLAVIFVAFMAWYFFEPGDFWVNGVASMNAFFGFLPWVLIVLIPGITMRLWSEESRGGTLETLMTSPLKSWQLVGGKFLSAWLLFVICFLCTLPLAITVSSLGDLDWGPVIGAYLGALLLGAALLSMGLWISALTSHQIVALLLTAVGIFVFVALSWIASRAGGDLGRFLDGLSVSGRFSALGRGVVDLRDVLYFVSFTSFFLYLNVQAIENRRYR